MAADKPVSNYEEVFEEGDVPKEAQTVHRIRANSTIMQLNKILGESPWGLWCCWVKGQLLRESSLQLPSHTGSSRK
jgi:hypothetical protein